MQKAQTIPFKNLFAYYNQLLNEIHRRESAILQVNNFIKF